MQALLVVADGLSCSVAYGIFPDPGIELVSLAMVGGFLTTGPPGKSQRLLFLQGLGIQRGEEGSSHGDEKTNIW